MLELLLQQVQVLQILLLLWTSLTFNAFLNVEGFPYEICKSLALRGPEISIPSSFWGERGESTKIGLVAITIGLQRELVKSPIPFDLALETLASGRGADAQVLYLGDIGKVI